MNIDNAEIDVYITYCIIYMFYAYYACFATYFVVIYLVDVA